MPALDNVFVFALPLQHYLNYSSLVIHDLIAQNRSGGQQIVELMGDDANPSKIWETLASLNPIVFSMCGHGNYCYDKDTEVLTDNGWKYFDQLSNEKVATLDKDGNLEYQKPTAKFSFDYSGQMLHVDGKRVDLLVTPNHTLFVAKNTRAGGKYGWTDFFRIEAQNTTRRQYKFKQSAKWNCSQVVEFEIPPVVKGRWNHIEPPKNISVDDWVKFFGIWLAEGCTNKSDRSYRVTITQNNNTKRALIRKWVEPIAKALECSILDYKSPHSKAIVLKNKQLFTYLRQFGKAKNKFIPKEIKELRPDLLKELLDAMILGDGVRRGNWACLDTASKKLADDVQEICLKIGLSATIAKFSRQELYRVAILNRDAVVCKESFHWERYSGKVACVTVPNGLLFVRRNGKPCWCGNSATSVECTELLMKVGDANMAKMAGRVVHLNSCQTGAQLGPAIMSAGALAYLGSNESFWFYVGDDPNTTRAVRSPFLAEWAFDVALLKGKTVGEARTEQLAKYEEELTYWVEGDGKNHPDAPEIARIININKTISTFAGEAGTQPSPAGGGVTLFTLPPEVMVPATFAGTLGLFWWMLA